MTYPEEPQYQRFEGTCRGCGKDVVYHSGIKRHPDYIQCDECEKAHIVETRTGEKTFPGAIKRSNTRPSWDEYFLAIAEIVSRRSTCPRARVGAVIVSVDNRIISTGYNGSPPGDAHCDDVGCLMVDGHCQRTLHAEVNAVAFAARAGVSLEGGRLYLYSSRGDMEPCRECSKVLKATGVKLWSNAVNKEAK